MASIIWDRDSQEAINNPYEYLAEEQFVRESKCLIDKLEKLILNKKNFYQNEKSLEKATWMLQVDVLFAFKDSIEVLDLKKHRLVGPLIRLMYENLHQIEYLNSSSKAAPKALSDWFENHSPSHNEYRNHIRNTKNKEHAELIKSQYAAYSKLTHRTYKSLLYNYALGAKSEEMDDHRIWYDEICPLRQSISMFYAIIGLFGKEIVQNFKQFGILTEAEVDDAWNNSIEVKQIPRGYITPEARQMFGLSPEEEV